MEFKYNQANCCGLCDLKICHNEECPKWQELKDYDDTEVIWELVNDDVNY